jgi:RimJ/RimL family protein N-acetyltransferase
MEALSSNRIDLRLIELADQYDIYAYRSQPEVYRYQTWKPACIEEVSEFITHRIVRSPNLPDTWLQFAIIDKCQHELIGDVGIHFLANEWEQVEIGITIRPQSQGKGFAVETMALVFDYVFNILKKHRIIASVDPENQSSIKLMEKMKMRKEAHFRKSVYLDGKWVDDVVYAIMEEEWRR